MNTLSRGTRVVWLLGLALLAVSLAGAGWILHGPNSEGPKDAEVAPSTSGLSAVCFGLVDVEPGVTALYPVQQGRVVAVLVKEAEDVKSGAPLLRLDDRLAKMKVEAARADLKAAQAQLSQAKKLPEQHKAQVAAQTAAIEAKQEDLGGARSLHKRAQELAEKKVINEAEVTAREATVKQLEAAVRAEQAKLKALQLLSPADGIARAEADVEAKQSQLEQAQLAVDECTLHAPQDGTVLRILVHNGDTFGAQSRQPALQFLPKAPRIIRAEVEQEFAGRVAVGQPATIQDDTTSSGTWTGKVLRIADSYSARRSIQEPFQFNDVRTLECIIAIDPDQPPLRINQRVRVRIGQTTR
jgi:HlyD family secretion protein